MGRATAAVLVLGIGGLTANTAGAGGISFEELTSAAGISFVGESKGASWGDVNGDGWPDIWVTNRYLQLGLYVNNRDGTFDYVEPDSPRKNAYGAAWADFDNDGDDDILSIAPGGCGGDCGRVSANILHVSSPSGLLERAFEYGVDYPEGRGRTPLWLDWNRDGMLDLLLANAAIVDSATASALFTQTDTIFVNDTDAALISPVTSAFAQEVRLEPRGNPYLFMHSAAYPLAIYDMSQLPFVDVKEGLNFPSAPDRVQDVAVGDFNGDLETDFYLARQTDIPFALLQLDNERADAQLNVWGDKQAFRFKAQGSVHFEFLGNLALRTERIAIGATGDSLESLTFTLSPADESTHGILLYQPGVDSGFFVGFDPVTGYWEVGASAAPLEHLFAVVRITAQYSLSGLEATIGTPTDGSAVDMLLIRNAAAGWTDKTEASGLAFPTGCGSVVTGDFDNDMDLDLYLVCRNPLNNATNLLYSNLGDGSFSIVSQAGGAAGSNVGRGDSAAVADFDLDGFLDLFVTNGDNAPPPFNQGPHQLFRNLGNANHWIEIDLEGVESNRPAVGAQVVVTAGGQSQIRQQDSGMHSFSQNFQRLHFGLAQHEFIDQATVYWPSGLVQQLNGLPADQVVRIIEPNPNLAPGIPRLPLSPEPTVWVLKESFDGPYHVRVVGNDQPVRYALKVLIDGAFGPVNPELLDQPADEVDVSRSEIVLRGGLTMGIDGIDFVVPTGVSGLIAFDVDGTQTDRALRVGPSGLPAAPVGYMMPFTSLPELPDFEPGGSLGLYLGRAGEHGILARINPDGKSHVGRLNIITNPPLWNIVGQDLEELDRLEITSYGLQLSSRSSVDWDGLSAAVLPNTTVSIVYRQDGLIAPRSVNPWLFDLGRPNAYELPVPSPSGDAEFDPARDSALFVWREDGTHWYLRASAGGQSACYAGTLTLDGSCTRSSAVDLESSDRLDQSDPQRLLFEFCVSEADTDGIDLECPEEIGIQLDLDQGNGWLKSGARVRIGGERWPIERLPVRLQSSVPDERLIPILMDALPSPGGWRSWLRSTGE